MLHPRHALFAATFAVALATTSLADACDCGGQTLPEAITNAEAVVLVTPLRAIDHSPRRRGPRVFEYVVRVDRAWKGARAGDTLTFWSTGSTCDLVDGPWSGPRVFFMLRGDQGRFMASMCSMPSFGRRMELHEVISALDAATRTDAGR
jgi:hypothetical protein